MFSNGLFQNNVVLRTGKMKAAVIVPTLDAGQVWPEWINALIKTEIDRENVYVIDSGSSDVTADLAVKEGFCVRKIDTGTFNHGATRQLAVDHLSGYDLVVFLTQDAVLSNSGSIRNILFPFDDDNVAAVCGRQLPRQNATVLEAQARLYNYPSESFVRSLQDRKKFGLKTAFISNSFAAYRVKTLNEVGGFPENVIFGEDMYVAARLLKHGYKIAYAADACVYHSHGYSFWQEMRRYFDMGVFHAREPWIREDLGGAEGEGIKFVVSEFKYLLRHAFWRIPEGVLRTVFRYTGFRLGLVEARLPLWLKKQLAMNKGYFKDS